MASSMSFKLGFVVVLCLLMGAPQLAQGAITCNEVTSNLVPCLAYLTGTGAGAGAGAVPGPCCSGIKTLNAAAQTTPDRQTACNCLKSIAATIPGINYGVAGEVPGKCGVNIPYNISLSTDCNSIK
ncbi:hypothetical protein PTKIN_Ptkin17bG0004500 [Pterospermum kingtungense]